MGTFYFIIERIFDFNSEAAFSGFSSFIIAETTAIPSIGLFFKTSQLSLFNPPIARTGISTALQISAEASTFLHPIPITLMII